MTENRGSQIRNEITSRLTLSVQSLQNIAEPAQTRVAISESNLMSRDGVLESCHPKLFSGHHHGISNEPSGIHRRCTPIGDDRNSRLSVFILVHWRFIMTSRWRFRGLRTDDARAIAAFLHGNILRKRLGPDFPRIFQYFWRLSLAGPRCCVRIRTPQSGRGPREFRISHGN